MDRHNLSPSYTPKSLDCPNSEYIFFVLFEKQRYVFLKFVDILLVIKMIQIQKKKKKMIQIQNL